MTSLWLRDLASYSLQVVLVVSAGALLARLFRFRACNTTLIYWQVLLAVCLLLPVCQPWKAAPVTSVPAITPGVITAVNPLSPARAPARAPRPERWPIEKGVLLIVMAGIVVRGLWLAAGFRALARLRRNSSVPSAALESVFAHTRQQLGVRARLRISLKAAAPVTFGLHQPVILLPSGLSAAEPEMQRAIISHELLHVRRHDWAWCVAEEFVRVILWFNPAIGWLIGRIHLVREQVVDQAVIEITASRERYIEVLLAVAQSKIRAGLIPAPLFLRRGLLKKRIAEILKETTMTTRRLIVCLAVSAAALFVVASTATSIFPLRTQAQEYSGDPIQVVQGNENLLHRATLVYPLRALKRGVEGDVALDVSVDEQGQVSDARVLSGPEELRRACLRSVLEWRYQPSKSASTSAQVIIRFQLPRDGSSSEVVLRGFPEGREGDVVRHFVIDNPDAAAAESQIKELLDKMQSPGATAEDKANYERQLAQLKVRIARDAGSADTQVSDPQDLDRETAELRAKLADPGTPIEERARLKKQLAEPENDIAQARDGQTLAVVVTDNDGEVPVGDKLTAIRAERVPQATLDSLMQRLGVHVGDMISKDTTQQVREIVRQTLGEQFRAEFHPSGEGGVEMVIVGP